MGSTKFRVILRFGLCVAFLIGLGASRAAAQTATATILGTVTDSSGAAVPDASVRVTNTGTGATQSTTSDAQGRYRVPDLPIGDYDVETEKMGFQTVDHKGITLSVGAEVVVDFALPVGQVSQSITVESDVSQVETASSEISNLVDQTQMRELPLNGRDFEQLVLLSPGVTIHDSIGKTAFNGFAPAYSVSGSRTRGQWEILDDNNVMNYQDRGSGSGVLGTSLGVDAIAEFEVLTNTYSAQYGGNGAVVNSVTKSGTNSLHGSGYEFLRNSALDARNFFDPPTIPEFRKNQFGGTLGGPIKKDKMFFFVNYEGVRQDTGEDYPYINPDAEAHFGFVPNTSPSFTTLTGVPLGQYYCATPGPGVGGTNATVIPYANGAGNAACAATMLPSVAQMMQYFPLPSLYPNVVDTTTVNGTAYNNGLVTAQETGFSPGREDYVVGRYDWTISSADNIFARYLYDGGNLFEPFNSATLSPAAPAGWGSQDRSRNQFLSIEEKHTASSNVIFATRFGFTRTLNFSDTPQNYPIFQFGEGNLWSGYPFAPPNGAISILPLVNPNITRPTLGGSTALLYIQNKFAGGEDVFWSKGAHSLRFGASIERVQTYGAQPATPGTWTFGSVASFIGEAPTIFAGPCNSQAFAANCGSLPTNPEVQDFRESDFGFYLQDDWRIRHNVTVNLGVRYSPETNPYALGYTELAVNLPFSADYNPALPMPGCITAGESPANCPALASGRSPLTPVHNIYLANPSFHNVDPRIGVAWDPFGDHKTAVRAGYGIFRSPVVPFDYAQYLGVPYLTATSACPAPCSTFPTPFQSAGPPPLVSPAGIDTGIKSTPYMQQYNLSVQHQISKNTTISVAYVGSHGVHLIGLLDENPPLPAGVPGAITVKSGDVLVPSNPETALTGGFTAGSTPTSANGQPIVDSATGQEIYSTVQCPAANPTTGCTVVANNRIDPLINYTAMKSTTFWSLYNSVQVNFTRRMTANLQLQAAYTYASCVTNSSGSTAFENGDTLEDTYNANLDRGPCAFGIRNDFYSNGVYLLPFHGNKLVEGWQLGGVFQYHSGGVEGISTGWAAGIVNATGGPLDPRPDLVSGCGNQILGTVAHWINTACYTMPPVGEVGNVGSMGITGPNSITLDGSIVKNTKITERYNVQFRAEFFNLTNRVNFRSPGQPVSPIFAEASPLPATCATTPSTCSVVSGTVGQLLLTNTNSRQIQFGLKFIF